jgi:chitinase
MKISHVPAKIVFGLLFILCSIASQAQGRKVGYMPSWAGDANSIQYNKLTHINYAFAIPQSNGSIYAVENGAKLQTIVSKAHAVGCKVMIAIGGWSNQGAPLDPVFESLASSADSRTRFVNDAMYIVNQYGLDGVDIDWEYPDAGASSNNFDALMAALSNALKPAGKLLSAAVIGNGGQGDGVSLTTLNRLDHLNVMAYDANNYDHSTYNYALQCLSYWSGRGLAKNKIVLGVPFYGRPSWSSFATLVSQGADPNADIFNGNGYNGKATIANKTNYVKNNGYGGIMIWELSQDATGGNSLVSVIHDNLGGVVQPPPVTQGPYGGTVLSLPGRLEAERYDVGGQGVAYNDNTSGNSGNTFRTDDVDVEACTEGGYNIGYVANGEWVEYTVNVTSAGTYKLDARVAAMAAGSSFSIEIPGSSTQTFTVPNTGGWQNWQTVTINNLNLTAGQKIIKLNLNGEFNLNYVDFTKASTPPPTGPVVVYQNCNNDPGYAVALQTGTYTTAQLNALGIADNDISTVTVQSGYQVTLYNDNNLSGASYTTTTNSSCLTTVGFNDMTSSIKVSLVTTNPNNQAPTVTLTSPGNGATANAPAAFTVSANASDADGSIAKVDFYNGSALLFSDNSAPYSYSWTGVAAGTYTIKAIATDDKGANATSGSVTITVNNPTTGGCAGVAQYVENGGYVAGSKVKNSGSQYQCKPFPFSGWCNGAAWAYGPGTGAYWTDAWTLVGSCGAGRSEEAATASVNEAVVSNSPNPFANVTTIEVSTAEAGDVSVKVYNKAGQMIRVISEGSLNAGTHQFEFDASGLQADMYLVKCTTPNGVITRKIIKTE